MVAEEKTLDRPSTTTKAKDEKTGRWIENGGEYISMYMYICSSQGNKEMNVDFIQY